MRLIAVLTALAALWVVAAVAAEIPKELEKDDASYVPSPSNDRERKEMQCSACVTTALELIGALRKVRKEFKYEPFKLKEYHLLAAAGDLCQAKSLHMGLLRDGPSKRVTTNFANDAQPGIMGKYAVVKGSWITHLWQQTCFESIDRWEDDLKVVYDDDGRTFHFCPQCASVGQKGRLSEAQLIDEQKAEL
eukprot:CAMPEP_0174850624 /NCGR_PEP_ID=MMETSP1114-20130205/20446_1 /TAXON_ID=312471 /ORGANISM="Neobodo designis, Strain CCAP 1951/1" /LENGTH=190 /DNA_ID=CAMNT_0016085093 /DNA_START=24 /DNA_END=596 /DNA_ORIENTATION=+